MISNKAKHLIDKYGYYQFALGSIFHQRGEVAKAEESLRSLVDHIESLESRVEELEDAQRWIPVKIMTPETSRLPEKYDVVIKGNPYANTAYYNNHKWFAYSGGDKYDITHLVTHWKERPLPPEDKNNEPA